MATAMYLEHYLDSKRPRDPPAAARAGPLRHFSPHAKTRARTPGPLGAEGRPGGEGAHARRGGYEGGVRARGVRRWGRRLGRANSRCVTEGRGQRAVPPLGRARLSSGRPRPSATRPRPSAPRPLGLGPGPALPGSAPPLPVLVPGLALTGSGLPPTTQAQEGGESHLGCWAGPGEAPGLGSKESLPGAEPQLVHLEDGKAMLA